MVNTTIYAASKAALLSLAKTLSGELAGRWIRVNAVSPGSIRTPLLSKLGLPEAELKAVVDGILSQIPVGRFGDPSEIAQGSRLFSHRTKPRSPSGASLSSTAG
jgi:NAD(P)-dependent dehydrogenase (short-subunit alcohol dehydrogenase family)